MKIEIKVKNPCAAVKFFNALNPFMFHDDDLPSFVQKHRQFLFMDFKTGDPVFVTVDLPESVFFQRDKLALGFEKESPNPRVRYRAKIANEPIPIVEYLLELEAIRIDGDEYPGPYEDRCSVMSQPNA